MTSWVEHVVGSADSVKDVGTWLTGFLSFGFVTTVLSGTNQNFPFRLIEIQLGAIACFIISIVFCVGTKVIAIYFAEPNGDKPIATAAPAPDTAYNWSKWLHKNKHNIKLWIVRVFLMLSATFALLGLNVVVWLFVEFFRQNSEGHRAIWIGITTSSITVVVSFVTAVLGFY